MKVMKVKNDKDFQKRQERYDLLTREALRFNGKFEGEVLILFSIIDLLGLVYLFFESSKAMNFDILVSIILNGIAIILGFIVGPIIIKNEKKINEKFIRLNKWKMAYIALILVMMAVASVFQVKLLGVSIVSYLNYALVLLLFPLFMYLNNVFYLVFTIVSYIAYVIGIFAFDLFEPTDWIMTLVILGVDVIVSNIFQLLRYKTKIKIVQSYEKQKEDLENLKKMNEEKDLLAIRLEESLKRDSLTGLYNRVFMDQSLNEFVSECIKNKEELALVMVDVDKFKSINDEYGHLAGDACLRKVAQLLQENVIQNKGRAFRYGGEEFVLLYKGISKEVIVDYTRMLEDTISDVYISEIDGRQITISWGYSMCVPTDISDINKLFEEADSNMYIYKRNKQNIKKR